LIRCKVKRRLSTERNEKLPEKKVPSEGRKSSLVRVVIGQGEWLKKKKKKEGKKITGTGKHRSHYRGSKVSR